MFKTEPLENLLKHYAQSLIELSKQLPEDRVVVSIHLVRIARELESIADTYAQLSRHNQG